MKITILGSGTAFPDLERNSAGVLIENEGVRSLVDFGYGNVHQLLRMGVTYHHIDQIFFTHPHPDHMCDLIYFLFNTRYPLDPRTTDLPIIAGPGFEAFFTRLMEAFNQWLVSDKYRVKIIEMDQEAHIFKGLTVTPGKVKHIPMSRAFRFTNQEGLSLVVSGDTDYSPDLVELAQETDLLILECSSPDGMKVEKHLTPSLCGRIARESNCKTLCLTHFFPSCVPEEAAHVCSEQFDGEIILAKDLTSINL